MKEYYAWAENNIIQYKWIHFLCINQLLLLGEPLWINQAQF